MQIRHEQSNNNHQTRQNTLIWMTLVKAPVNLIIMFISLLINIPVMNAVWRERRELEALTVEHMRDIGIDPLSVQLECKRSFFDIPANRRKWVSVTERTNNRREF